MTSIHSYSVLANSSVENKNFKFLPCLLFSQQAPFPTIAKLTHLSLSHFIINFFSFLLLLSPHSSLCTPDTLGNPVCHCRQGHEGDTCDSCSEGYFGAPPDFRCTRCDCNGNINPSVPGSCDTDTGQCIKCTNNSTGDECETCAPGFYGNATTQDCQRK